MKFSTDFDIYVDSQAKHSDTVETLPYTNNSKQDWNHLNDRDVQRKYTHSGELYGPIEQRFKYPSYDGITHIRVYQDQTFGDRGETSTGWLSAVIINGQHYGAPQPMARFGPSYYREEKNKPTSSPKRRPWYGQGRSDGDSAGVARHLYKDDTNYNEEIPRAEVAAVTNRALGRTTDMDYVKANQATMRSYKDVDASAWYAPEVLNASTSYTFDTKTDRWMSHGNGLDTRAAKTPFYLGR